MIPYPKLPFILALIASLAKAICPKEARHWLSDMHYELAFIKGFDKQLNWVLGALGFAFRLRFERLTSFGSLKTYTLAAATLAAVLAFFVFIPVSLRPKTPLVSPTQAPVLTAPSAPVVSDSAPNDAVSSNTGSNNTIVTTPNTPTLRETDQEQQANNALSNDEQDTAARIMPNAESDFAADVVAESTVEETIAAASEPNQTQTSSAVNLGAISDDAIEATGTRQESSQDSQAYSVEASIPDTPELALPETSATETTLPEIPALAIPTPAVSAPEPSAAENTTLKLTPANTVRLNLASSSSVTLKAKESIFIQIYESANLSEASLRFEGTLEAQAVYEFLPPAWLVADLTKLELSQGGRGLELPKGSDILEILHNLR